MVLREPIQSVKTPTADRMIPPPKWAHLPFFSQEFEVISAAIKTDQRRVLPPTQQRFEALNLTPPNEVRVVILGQDPYPTPGHAHGLAFSVETDISPLPRSLNNIFKEMHDDLGEVPHDGNLRFWAAQGVLLLNTVLTVPAGEANGHKSLGWQSLTFQVLQHASQRPTAFLLWGKQAQTLARYISSPKTVANVSTDHLLIKTAHPSPLSARRGFFGSRPFSRINKWLADRGEPKINWTTA